MDPTPLPTPGTWLPVDASPESTAVRAIALLVIIVAAWFMAKAAWGALARGREGAGPAARRAIGRPEPAPWATGEWACGRCRSFNHRSAVRCSSCRRLRAEAEVPLKAPETAADVLPAAITVRPGSVVLLEHRAAAHRDGLSGHWRLHVNGLVVGSAARRDGALALLRSVDGADSVHYDFRGTGAAILPIPALIAAFEAPRLPVPWPCPEQAP